MKRALRLAKKGLGLTSPNPPVGAIIVAADESILGSGYHRRAGGALKSATLYVTLEPCSTTGKTPACTDAIIEQGFARVVYGCSDPNPDHKGRAKRLLARAGIAVTRGVLKEECRFTIRFFAKVSTTGLPWVIAKSALTLDGHTSLPPGQGPWITGKEALADVQKLRSQVDAILIGGATLRQDNPRLTLRGVHARRKRPQPWRIIVSRSGDLPSNARVFTDRHRHRTRVYEKCSLRQVLSKLVKVGVQSVMLESGGKLLGSALEANLIDEVVFYYAPIIGGGSTHAVQAQNLARRLSDMETKKFGSDLRIRGLIKHD